MEEAMWYVQISRGEVSIKPATLIEKTSGWCNRHQKEYNYSDCSVSSKGYRNRLFYLCPDCVAENCSKPLSIGTVAKIYEWR